MFLLEKIKTRFKCIKSYFSGLYSFRRVFANQKKAASDLKKNPDKDLSFSSKAALKTDSDSRIYADYSATTPCAPEVFEEMLPYFSIQFGNAGSKSHSFGWEAEEAVEKARNRIADAISCNSKEVIIDIITRERDQSCISFQVYICTYMLLRLYICIIKI